MKTSDWPHASELTHEEWRDRLRHYVRRSDRTAEPVFVGREDIFERVGDCIEKARDRDEVANLTIVVSGAPGAGKSAFIAECMRRCAESGSAVPVELDHDGLWPDKLASGIGEALSLPKETPARTSRSVQVSVGLPDGPSATIGYGSSQTETDALMRRARDEGGVPWQTIRDAYGKVLGRRPVLLCVDEAQNFTREGNKGANLPFGLHKGPTGLRESVPIVPLYGGLADTERVLDEECRITRPDEDNVFALGRLSRDESRACVQAIEMDYFGLVGRRSTTTPFLDWLVEQGADWPQHLRSQNEAVALAMLDANSRELGDLDIEQVCGHIAKRRNEYYDRRIAKFRTAAGQKAALAMIRAAEQGGLETEIEDAAETVLAASGETAHVPEELMADMVHAGVLQRIAAEHRYDCPIPSVKEYVEHGRHVVREPDFARSSLRHDLLD